MDRSKRPLPHAALGLVAAAALVAACSWSVPANPGRNASLRAPSTTWTLASSSGSPRPGEADQDADAARLYVSHCGRCHAPFPPTQVPAARWPFFVAMYAPRAGLFGTERERVLAWLMANAE